MANPRRGSLQLQNPNPNPTVPFPDPSIPPHSPPPPFSSRALSSSLSSLALFLKKPTAFPFLLSVFILLTWLSLRFHGGGGGGGGAGAATRGSAARAVGGGDLDVDANLVRFSALGFPSLIAKDHRGWLLDPVAAAKGAGLRGGALDCSLPHVGQIRPGGLRGNHRHHSCNETLIIWGAETKFRLENADMKNKGFAEVTIGADEVAIATSPSGTAHALINVDLARSTFFLGCQDTSISPNSSNTDYNVWKDL
ncbi:uncharacterized protein LOC109728358 [Ananas comosus]|uniref:Uncharacterized protein LOC109728358 n=1 Tax=Ananas comosus TaxID=4615 RepID=A0A199VCV4_ANACO|nr:uncharacterized protein LOC109728358 [Ananas comosus]OAY74848.1 hypothetical protein ACMD2_07016 [Ananas comosus]